MVTLVRNRTEHLANVLRGLARQSRIPDEVVVVVMGGQDPEGRVPELGLPLTYVRMPVTDGQLPLASARNTGAETASADRLIFLDVDCIPGAELVGRYADALDVHELLLMGEVRYLEPDATAERWDEAVLRRRSQPHPARIAPGTEGLILTDRHELFWSLSFAVRRDTFLTTIGGFDPALDGYGGEDTDLAFTARAQGVPLAWLGAAVAYHQHHETFAPPLQHLASIVANATVFRRKWGVWPMEGWLTAFHELGLVWFDPEDDRLELVRAPTDAEVQAARRHQVVSSA